MGRVRGLKIILNFHVVARTPLRQERTHHTYTSGQVGEPWWPRVRTDGLRPTNSNRPRVSRLVRQHAPCPALYAPPSPPAGRCRGTQAWTSPTPTGRGKDAETPHVPYFPYAVFQWGSSFEQHNNGSGGPPGYFSDIQLITEGEKDASKFWELPTQANRWSLITGVLSVLSIQENPVYKNFANFCFFVLLTQFFLLARFAAIFIGSLKSGLKFNFHC